MKGGDWQLGICNCSPCGSCMLAFCVPCLLVGRTASRLKDPTSESPDMFNGDCLIHGFLTLIGSGWIYSMIKRVDIRERFMIPGSQFGDCCTAFWCQCCQIIQADNEVKVRLTPKVNKTGYAPQRDGMVAYP
ncbi:PLAC8 family protein [Xylaria cf. heliscus]|nr:PLAC8 family protein [Xylaria cf. heliscus]